jgi:hypothetical protein
MSGSDETDGNSNILFSLSILLSAIHQNASLQLPRASDHHQVV